MKMNEFNTIEFVAIMKTDKELSRHPIYGDRVLDSNHSNIFHKEDGRIWNAHFL